jgi:arylformamidase
MAKGMTHAGFLSQATRWIDISVPLRKGMVHWPGDPPFDLERIHDMGRGDRSNLSRIALGAHSGTHVDSPLHFIRAGAGVSDMPLNAAVGRARVIEISDTESINPAELRRHGIRRGERLLFKTRNSSRVWRTDSFVEDFVFISPGAARFLARRGVTLVGVDYLSVGSYRHAGRETHLALLQAGVWIIEGLDLSQVPPGRYDLVCLPLRIEGAEGAPARAILRPVGRGRAQP